MYRMYLCIKYILLLCIKSKKKEGIFVDTKSALVLCCCCHCVIMSNIAIYTSYTGHKLMFWLLNIYLTNTMFNGNECIIWFHALLLYTIYISAI